MTQLFSVIFSLLGCAPVPPQNKYFESLREWYLHFRCSCLANLITFIPNEFSLKIPISLSCIFWIYSCNFALTSSRFFVFILLGFEWEPHWFLGHHPELEPPSFNPTAQSCYTIDYRPPYAAFSLLVSNSQRRNKKDARNVTEMERICTLCLQKNRRPLCQQCYKDILQAKRPVTH